MYKATLGYPSRTAAVEALLAEGRSVDEIVETIGGTANSVYQLISLSQRRVTDRKVILSRELVNSLKAPAAARGIEPAELVLQLLEVIVRDDVFDALLGESGEAPSPPAAPLHEASDA